jgi:hypothetical protein
MRLRAGCSWAGIFWSDLYDHLEWGRKRFCVLSTTISKEESVAVSIALAGDLFSL